MMTPDLYSSLEGFLLLRCLPESTSGDFSFDTISESLRNNTILQKCDSFDAGKLGPDYLKNLFVRLFKEEARQQRRDDDDKGRSRSPGKRKSSSPRPETVEEASRHLHLLPRLTERFYFRYQKAATQAIIQDEQKYSEIRDKARSSGTKRPAGQEQISSVTATTPYFGVPSIHNLLRHEEEKSLGNGIDRVQAQSYVQSSRYRPEARAAANGALPAQRAVHSPDSQIPSQEISSGQRGVYRYGGHTGLPPSAASYIPPPPNQGMSPYPVPSNEMPGVRPTLNSAAPSPSPRVGNASTSPPESSSASPIILPPVSGMLTSKSAPAQPEQQYRSSPNISTPQSQTVPPRPASTRLPTPRNYVPPPYSYHENQPYNYAPYNQPYHVQSFHGTTAPHPPQYANYASYQTSMTPHVQYPNYYTSYYPQQGTHTPYGKQLQTSNAPVSSTSQQTLTSETPQRNRPAPLTPLNTSTSSTKWKYVDLKGAQPPGSPVRPVSRDVSPISPASTSPTRDEVSIRRQGPHDQTQTDEKSAKPSDTPQGRSGNASRRGRVAQGANTPRTSERRTRSFSNVSHTDDQLADSRRSGGRKIKPDPSVISTHKDDVSTMSPAADESSRRPGRRRRDTQQDSDRPATPQPPAKRKRHDSSTLPLPSPSLRSTPAVPGSQTVSLPRKSGYVLAFRNLPRTSSALLNTITQHKYASLFAKPLTEREAPGYEALIYRVQDLKSIRSALSAGSRAVAAMVEQAATEKPPSHLVWVPESEDVVPPKAIVNSSQLEKELIRIFANAVMFNPDLAENRGLGPAFRTRARTLKDHLSEITTEPAEPDASDEIEGIKFEIGVARPEAGALVKDTRDMFAAVEEALDEWKGIGAVSEEEAKEAPVIGKLPIHQSRGRGKRASEASHESFAEDGDDETKEASEEPRPKRRRR